MNRSSAGLAVVAGLLMLMLTFGGVCFLAGAGYLALAGYMSPWLAALITGAVLLTPLLTAVMWLLWDARQRDLQRRHRLDAVKAVLADSARNDPYGFVGAAFMSGMMLSLSPNTRERFTEYMAVYKATSSRPG